MKINEIIKEKRNSKGLTQENVANYLGVSTPAVNKWEKGVSYPDITILPALARLLGVDLNTLLSFNDNLSDQEIGHFSNELANIISTKSFDTAFEFGINKIHEYPTCDKLILTTATLLDGMLSMYGSNNKKYYKDEIEKLYIRTTNSEDLSIKNTAISMLIRKFLERKEFEKAQEYIDSLEEIVCDKQNL
ncbi:MAG: helix-turn-helix domain-containing protein [Sarcina sp.]